MARIYLTDPNNVDSTLKGTSGSAHIVASSKTESAITKGTVVDCKAIWVGTGGTIYIARNGVKGPALLNVSSGFLSVSLIAANNDSVHTDSTAADMVAVNW